LQATVILLASLNQTINMQTLNQALLLRCDTMVFTWCLYVACSGVVCYEGCSTKQHKLHSDIIMQGRSLQVSAASVSAPLHADIVNEEPWPHLPYAGQCGLGGLASSSLTGARPRLILPLPAAAFTWTLPCFVRAPVALGSGCSSPPLHRSCSCLHR
jgi:hypothetical protein